MKVKSLQSGCMALLVASTLVGCASKGTVAEAEPYSGGKLVIVGGALELSNEIIYKSTAKLAGDEVSIGVLPTASGVPEESGPGTVEDFGKYGIPATLINVTMNNPEAAADPAIAEQIRSHKSIFFTGGDQARIIAAFRPDSGDTVGYTALKEVLAGSGVIAGTSAGAAMMSDPCIRWGTSAEALLIGRSNVLDHGVGIGKGMGFFPYGITDQHFIRRGRIGRLIVALHETETRWGFGVEENRALIADLATGNLTASGGPNGIVIVDMKDAKKDGLRWENVRISLLGDADVINGNTGVYTIKPELKLVPPVADSTVTVPAILRIWEDGNFVGAMAQLAYSGTSSVTGHDENFELKLSADEQTQLYIPPAKEGVEVKVATAEFSAVNVRLDIIPKESAAGARERLLAELANKQ